MKKNLLAASILAAVSGSVMAAPAAPSIDLYGSNNLQFSKIQLAMDTTSGYNSMVQYNEEAEIGIKFNQWSGTPGDTYRVLFDGIEVATGPITGSQTTTSFKYSKGGVYQVVIEACDSTGCTASAAAELTLADTDGSHLAPLTMNIDPNNKTYNTDKNTVVGTYFVEWGIFARDYTVDNIPADNLTHILYGFIPICGPNESLKSVGGSSFKALQVACQDVNDYEVVIHDPFAAYQKIFKQAGHNFNTPIKGNYAMMMALKKRYPDLKILPSVGGWTLSDPFFDFTDKANRDVFVASVKKFLKTWKFFDGVDIDWEFPGGGGENASLGDPVNDGPAYVALMAELRAMLDELSLETGKEYEVTSAIGVGYDKIEDVDYAQAVQYMDYIFAMTYDFYGGWNNVPGHQTALYCGSFMAPGQCDGSGVDAEGVPFKGPAYTADNGIQLLLAQGVPAKKLVLGAAMYGRGWDGVMPPSLTDPNNPMTGTGNGKLTGTTTQGVWEAGVIDYKGIKKYMLGANNQGINGFEYGYDEQAQAPYVWNRTTGQLITFDDARSTKTKGAYARELGLAGMFSWEIDADNGDILNAIHDGLTGYVPVTEKPTLPPTLIPTDDVPPPSLPPVTVTPTPPPPTQPPVVGCDGDLIYGDIAPTCVPVTPPPTQPPVIGCDGELIYGGMAPTCLPATPIVVTEPPVTEPPITWPPCPVYDDGRQSLSCPPPPPPTWIAGLTQVNNGDVVSYMGACYEAKNNPGVWEAPRAGGNWFWTEVGCYGNVTKPTTVPTQPTQAPVQGSWSADTVYTSGQQVTANGVTYEARWWTQGDNPEQTGDWGVWKKL
ncbi:glycosyl hydrolase family 18 protein [Motilimonas pumila]|uniref:chitinase n=1 Tax=Motilimonas pumila TaxID=2303987 RepID=A0A418YF50_9GAMM|nr:glycosyl hydrolase family 18 protein [Motilimonas pumila]RJG47885.1 chitinase [Motilimonas pumila]